MFGTSSLSTSIQNNTILSEKGQNSVTDLVEILFHLIFCPEGLQNGK